MYNYKKSPEEPITFKCDEPDDRSKVVWLKMTNYLLLYKDDKNAIKDKGFKNGIITWAYKNVWDKAITWVHVNQAENTLLFTTAFTVIADPRATEIENDTFPHNMADVTSGHIHTPSQWTKTTGKHIDTAFIKINTPNEDMWLEIDELKTKRAFVSARGNLHCGTDPSKSSSEMKETVKKRVNKNYMTMKIITSKK